MFSEQGILPSDLKVVPELGSTESLKTTVSKGRGLSVISANTARKAEAAGLIGPKEINDMKNTRKVYMAKKQKQLPVEMKNFWDYCRHFEFKHALLEARERKRLSHVTV